MGNTHIRRLTAPKRLFAGKSNHKHEYNIPINLEVHRVNEHNEVYSIRYYKAIKCVQCNAMTLGDYIENPIAGIPIIRVRTKHKHRIDIFDIELF